MQHLAQEVAHCPCHHRSASMIVYLGDWLSLGHYLDSTDDSYKSVLTPASSLIYIFRPPETHSLVEYHPNSGVCPETNGMCSSIYTSISAGFFRGLHDYVADWHGPYYD